MNNTEYYKSLISDEEVIKALIKESKTRRDLLKEKTRMRPNLHFFQRTVTNLVTSNKRVNTTKESLDEEKEEPCGIQSISEPPETSSKETYKTNKVTLKGNDSKCKRKCRQLTRLSNSTTNVVSPVEQAYKEDMNKYFVRANEGNTSKRSTKIRKFNVNDTVKPKGIVFNLNFSKDRLEKNENQSVSKRKKSSEKYNRTIPKSSFNSATNVTNCSEISVIQISDSESD